MDFGLWICFESWVISEFLWENSYCVSSFLEVTSNLRPFCIKFYTGDLFQKLRAACMQTKVNFPFEIILNLMSNINSHQKLTGQLVVTVFKGKVIDKQNSFLTSSISCFLYVHIYVCTVGMYLLFC